MHYFGLVASADLGFHILWFVLLTVFLISFLTRDRRHRYGFACGPRYGGSPTDIAKARYAKGDITQEEYERIVKNLS
jgi:uncharacterized membrane protein